MKRSPRASGSPREPFGDVDPPAAFGSAGVRATQDNGRDSNVIFDTLSRAERDRWIKALRAARWIAPELGGPGLTDPKVAEMIGASVLAQRAKEKR